MSQPVDYTKRAVGTLFDSSGFVVCDVIVYGYELRDLQLDSTPLRRAADRLARSHGTLVGSPFALNEAPRPQPD